MNPQVGLVKKEDTVPRLQLFNCSYAECGATFTRQWRLLEHETVHTGARPHKCAFVECGRSFTRKSHLTRHVSVHSSEKNFKCTAAACGKSFYAADKLKRHVRYAHSEKRDYFQCKERQCTKMFRKRRALKLHLATHGTSSFRCSKSGCGMRFKSHVARKAHHRRHTGYRCLYAECPISVHNWTNLRKHMASHPASFCCMVCQKAFRKRDALRRHKRTHALQKPVLVCPSQGCQAYFSTTFNLQHHIRKVHLQLLSHRCSFPGCSKTFAMRESLVRHMLHHEPDVVKLKHPHKRSSKSWQKRLEGRNRRPLVEDLHSLFSLRMNITQRAKLEADLTGLFNERKIPHHIDPEVNLRDLFSIRATPKVVDQKK
ncbi:P43 5S RNA-binding protein [Pimephales promelas]|uniref:P43 5S RNA-binding protein n=1 Tax=Pimephales promelas TaxID=90988 RepID=UPI00195585C8|nr:P43 5S RNA-binding protein [Pimephales promelas]KAG1930224.1 transcription factor IIIA [Pimephales promelas]